MQQDPVTRVEHESGNPRSGIAECVVELVYTSYDMEPFARDLGYEGPPFRWDPDRRATLRAELDAGFFDLYGLSRDEIDYVMDTLPLFAAGTRVRRGCTF